jgi:transcriptional regulator with XRE-family HTH domain
MSLSAQLPARDPVLLGHALKTLRKRRGLSQAELAQSLGLHRSYLSQLESGGLNEQVMRVFDVLMALNAELAIVDRESR